jgi:tetratricopeptide (TPR) repeat protein
MAGKKRTRRDGRHIPVDPKVAAKLALKFEIGLARAVLDVNADHRAALEMLGVALTKARRFEEALKADIKLTEVAPKSPYAFYNLACSYSNLGQVDEGLAALKRALDLGYKDFGYMMSDEDLDAVRRDPRFKKLLDKKWGKRQP